MISMEKKPLSICSYDIINNIIKILNIIQNLKSHNKFVKGKNKLNENNSTKFIIKKDNKKIIKTIKNGKRS